ncbi:inhibitory synaptic factor 1 isoform X1 [Corvus hawaiiensis]|uniref:inhibitory synaptic factor 1 isoform X1 n=1 Tax=Corvus hawaiiensis TaxID=134902 RepID=UPI002018DA90|nr:inhibitory synaptic factor 1 isoform X1 [Corvus hawaiiensis]
MGDTGTGNGGYRYGNGGYRYREWGIPIPGLRDAGTGNGECQYRGGKRGPTEPPPPLAHPPLRSPLAVPVPEGHSGAGAEPGSELSGRRLPVGRAPGGGGGSRSPPPVPVPGAACAPSPPPRGAVTAANVSPLATATGGERPRRRRKSPEGGGRRRRGGGGGGGGSEGRSRGKNRTRKSLERSPGAAGARRKGPPPRLPGQPDTPADHPPDLRPRREEQRPLLGDTEPRVALPLEFRLAGNPEPLLRLLLLLLLLLAAVSPRGHQPSHPPPAWCTLPAPPASPRSAPIPPGSASASLEFSGEPRQR